MRQTASTMMIALCASAWVTVAACAQGTAPTADGKAPVASSNAEAPRPDELLRKMADYLGELPAFACRVESTIEIKAEGMDNRMTSRMSVRLQRPNQVAIVLEEGMMGMTIVSDGKQLIQYIPMLDRYAVQDAPQDFASFNETIGAAGVPMMGLSGGMIPTSGEEFYKTLIEGVEESEYLGTENVGEARCHRCRFVQEGFSWDIWIDAGDQPLVRKVVPDLSKQFADAGMMEDATLEWTVTFSEWNVSPQFTDSDFAFTPPADAEKVDSLFEGLAGGGEQEPHPLVGQPAPSFETVDLEGQAIDLKQHLGKEVVMLDFWATWCGPCVRAMPEVDAVAEKFAPRGVVFYAVNVAEDAETVKEFLKSSEIDVPVAMDPDGNISAQLYQAEGIPQTVLIGKDGKVQVVHIGFSQNLGKQLTQDIEDLLAGKDLASATLAEADEADGEDPGSDSDTPPGEGGFIDSESTTSGQ